MDALLDSGLRRQYLLHQVHRVTHVNCNVIIVPVWYRVEKCTKMIVSTQSRARVTSADGEANLSRPKGASELSSRKTRVYSYVGLWVDRWDSC